MASGPAGHPGTELARPDSPMVSQGQAGTGCAWAGLPNGSAGLDLWSRKCSESLRSGGVRLASGRRGRYHRRPDFLPYQIFELHLARTPAGQGGKAARRQGGKAARRQGGKAARRQGGKAARRQGDKAARRQGDKAARRQGGKAARRQGDKAAGR